MKAKRFNLKKFLIFFLFVIERWDHHWQIHFFEPYMPTKFGDIGLSYLRDILLNEVKIHPNKGFPASRGLKLWETYFFIICHTF